MQYEFLIDTYRTERIKVLSVWSMFRDEHLSFRPHPEDRRGRSVHEQMVHQCVSEDFWFRTMLGIDVDALPLPKVESRLEFIDTYAKDSLKRLDALQSKPESWWSEIVRFFEVQRSRTWVMVRRIAHTAHHRGQQTAMLRMLNCDLHSTYGPTADTGGLMQNHAPVIYAYSDVEALLEGERGRGQRAKLPGVGDAPSSERPHAIRRSENASGPRRSGQQHTHHEAEEWLPASGRLKGVGAYDRMVRMLSLDTIYELVLEQLVCCPGNRLLEIGCGTGSLGSMLLRTHPKVSITGLDRDRRMLVRAADRQRSSGVSWVEGAGQRLPFAAGAFGIVTATLFLHHLTSAQKTEALSEANRVLRPGGSLHVADWIEPKPGIAALGFTLVRLLDGYERTADHATGRLGNLNRAAGFSPVEQVQTRDTWLGTLGFFRATKVTRD